MGESHEYDVVTLKWNRGALSILCALPAFLFGILIDELPYVLPYSLRRYLGIVMLAALLSAACGLLLGLSALRKPQTRNLARLGILMNAVLLALEGLFVLAFRLILGR